MGDLTLLYVDDDDAAFFLLQYALREAPRGVELHRVADGEQALAFLRHAAPYQSKPRPNLILLDLNLPRKTGMELLSELKGDESLRRIPVIVFSSSSLPTDKDQSLALGAKDYVTKPPNLEGFLVAVRRMISEGR